MVEFLQTFQDVFTKLESDSTVPGSKCNIEDTTVKTFQKGTSGKKKFDRSSARSSVDMTMEVKQRNLQVSSVSGTQDTRSSRGGNTSSKESIKQDSNGDDQSDDSNDQRSSWLSPCSKMETNNIGYARLSASPKKLSTRGMAKKASWEHLSATQRATKYSKRMGQSCGGHLDKQADLIDLLVVPECNCQERFCRRLIPCKTLREISWLSFREIKPIYKPITKDNVVNSTCVQNAIGKVIKEHREKEGIDLLPNGDATSSRAESTSPAGTHSYQCSRAVRMFTNMKSAISCLLLRVAAFVVNRIFRNMFTGIHVKKEDLENLRRVMNQPGDGPVPIIYLPLHRSHLDYIMLTYVLFLSQLRVPCVAAGDNLNIPFFGKLLRGFGGFFIRRKLDLPDGTKDHLYRAVLYQYVCEVLGNGHSLEFYLEGGRSRTGKTLLPKSGILSIIVESYHQKLISDAIIVPVSFAYDKLLEGNFVSEQTGAPKKAESFWHAVKSIWKVLNSDYGNIRVDMATPFSLKNFIQHRKNQGLSMTTGPPELRDSEVVTTFCPQLSLLLTTSPSSLNLSQNKFSNPQIAACPSSGSLTGSSGAVINPVEQVTITSSLANHSITQANQALSMTASNVLAFILLYRFARGEKCTEEQLKRQIWSLCELLSDRGRNVSFSMLKKNDIPALIRHAVDLLGDNLIAVEKRQVSNNCGESSEMVVSIPEENLLSVLELHYYANPVCVVFLGESLLALAIQSLVTNASDSEFVYEMSSREGNDSKPNTEDGFMVSYQELRSAFLQLCHVLQLEFVDLSCSSVALQDLMADAICKMLNAGLLFEETQTSNARASTFEVVDDWLDDAETTTERFIRVSGSTRCRQELDFLCSLITPFIESYWFVATSLPKITTSATERQLVQTLVSQAQKKLKDGAICYSESVAADTITNAVRLFEQWGVLEGKREDGVKKLALNSMCVERTEIVGGLVESLEKFKVISNV